MKIKTLSIPGQLAKLFSSKIFLEREDFKGGNTRHGWFVEAETWGGRKLRLDEEGFRADFGSEGSTFFFSKLIGDIVAVLGDEKASQMVGEIHHENGTTIASLVHLHEWSLKWCQDTENKPWAFYEIDPLCMEPEDLDEPKAPPRRRKKRPDGPATIL